MRNDYPKFVSKQHLSDLVDNYFDRAAKNPSENKTIKSKDCGTPAEEPQSKECQGPATITGLAFYLGFTSKEQFESYEENGKFAACIKRARLRIEEVYEKKLHQQPSGVIFALKALGWSEKTESKKNTAANSKTLRVIIVDAGPKPVSSEKEVDI